MSFDSIKDKWLAFSGSILGKRVIKGVQLIFTAIIILFLFYQLTSIGWSSILTSFPTNPWFYILFLMQYLALPISEQFIFRYSLNFKFWEGFKVFMIKKILNSDVIAYSGEAYLYAYGAKHWDAGHKKIFSVVKDNTIISGFTSTLTAVVILTMLIYFGQVNFLDFITISDQSILSIILFVVAILCTALYFRKRIIGFDTATTIKIFSIHQVRMVFVYALMILQCVVVMPEIPLNIWFTFLAIKIITTRIPFLPSQDILLLGIYAEVTKMYDVPQAEIMAVFLMITALGRVMNLLFYAGFSVDKKLLSKPETERA